MRPKLISIAVEVPRKTPAKRPVITSGTKQRGPHTTSEPFNSTKKDEDHLRTEQRNWPLY